MKSRVTFIFLALMLPAVQAENWPRFRGPTGQGHSGETNLPIRWSTTENVVWKTVIPGEGWSSPIVWADRVFVTATTEEGVSCRVLCLDRATGRVLWDTEALRQVPLHKERKNSYATPTPATDGQRVYAVFGGGGLAALSMTGEVLWTNLEVAYYSRHGLGASPLVWENLVIMCYDGSNRVTKPGDWPNNPDEERLGWQIPWDQAQIVALDTRSGDRIWTGRRGLSRIAHVTPVVFPVDGQDQLLSAAGDVVQGFDPRTGARLWTVASQGEGVVPSPAAGDGLVFASSGFEKTTLRAIKTGGRGDVTDTHIAWEQRKGVPTQCSLLYVRPYLYALTDGGILNCYHGRTGDLAYQERVGGNHCASPIYADGKIYTLSEEGETAVIQTGAEFRVLSRNNLGERCQASIAVSQGQLFIRSERHLYCIGPS